MVVGRGQGPAQAATPHPNEDRVWTSRPYAGPRRDPHNAPMTPPRRSPSTSDASRPDVADSSGGQAPVAHDAEGRLPAGSLPGWGLSWWLHEQGLLAGWQELSMAARLDRMNEYW